MAEHQKPKGAPGRFARWRERVVGGWRRGGDIQRRVKAGQRAGGGGRGDSGRGFGGTDAGNFGGGAG